MESLDRADRRKDTRQTDVLFTLLWLFLCVPQCTWASEAPVFLTREGASSVLQRTRRANYFLEELKAGDLERECLEEKCSYEEAREIFKFPKQLNEFWKIYTVQDHCESKPCKHGATCVAQVKGYICHCPPRYHGRHCEKAVRVSYGCLFKNGGCEHFCTPSRKTPSRNATHTCHCHHGYSLAADNTSCLPQVPVPCGKIVQHFAPRVVNGYVCPKGQCPWQAMLSERVRVRSKQGKQQLATINAVVEEPPLKYLCGAIVISPQWILTAAHCVWRKHPSTLHITVGEHDRLVDERTEHTRRVSSVIVHPSYNFSTSDSDLALMRLHAAVPLGPYVVPVCLPARTFVRTLGTVRMSTVSGWGRVAQVGPPATVLQRLEIPKVHGQECRAHTQLPMTRNMMCAGVRQGGRDACQGDSGGPLVTRYKNTWFLTGVVSWGRGCAQQDLYGVYVKVTNFLGWLERTMASTEAGGA